MWLLALFGVVGFRWAMDDDGICCVVVLAMVCLVFLAPSLALTMVNVILGIMVDLVDWLFAMTTDRWFTTDKKPLQNP